MNYIGDICYIYEYKNRNNIKNFSDLIKIKVTDAAPEDNIVSGYEIDNENVKSVGIVKYRKINNLILDNRNNTFFISYKKNKKSFDLSLKEYKKEQLYSLFFCFKINELQLKFNFPDVLFDSEVNVMDFLDLLNYSHFEIDSEKITFICNNKEYIIKDFYVYFNGKLINKDYKKILFNYLCKTKNSINSTEYDFYKKFSLKLYTFEIIKADIN